MFSRFDRIPPCDRQTDGQTDGRADILPRHSPRYAYASRGKKSVPTDQRDSAPGLSLSARPFSCQRRSDLDLEHSLGKGESLCRVCSLPAQPFGNIHTRARITANTYNKMQTEGIKAKMNDKRLYRLRCSL